MAYDMNAEGINGVQQSTSIVVNSGDGGWIQPPPPNDNGDIVPEPYTVLFVSGQGIATEGPPANLVAVQGLGGQQAPGVVGQGNNVGVAGFATVGLGAVYLDQAMELTAGVFGLSDPPPAPGCWGKAALPLIRSVS
jgi:hypothetical protein